MGKRSPGKLGRVASDQLFVYGPAEQRFEGPDMGMDVPDCQPLTFKPEEKAAQMGYGQLRHEIGKSALRLGKAGQAALRDGVEAQGGGGPAFDSQVIEELLPKLIQGHGCSFDRPFSARTRANDHCWLHRVQEVSAQKNPVWDRVLTLGGDART